MSVIYHDDWELSEKGKKDAQRHREKIDKSIRDNVRDVISEESIITRKKGKKVKIPVKGLKDYKFVHGGNEDGGGGAGQGDVEPGDVIGQKQKKGSGGKGDKAGNQKGEDYMETEVDIDYLINIMFDDLGLPWIEEKTKKEQLIPKGWKFESISKVGITPRLHKRRTMMEAIKRMISYEAEIMEETGCDEEDAKISLMYNKGDVNDSIELINDKEKFEKVKKENDIECNVVIEDDDMRFKQIENDVEYHSNCVVLAMMDTSGSMTKEKKYLARSMLFWMVEFLKKCYDNVQIKFIQHTTEANVVDEETFFHKGESGGTMCHTAFDKASYLIDTEFPINEWNVYCVYMSDGDDWDTARTSRSIKELLNKKINMLSYCEINLHGGHSTQLSNEIRSKWKFKRGVKDGTSFYKSEEDRFLICIIKGKEHIWPALQWMLFSKREK